MSMCLPRHFIYINSTLSIARSFPLFEAAWTPTDSSCRSSYRKLTSVSRAYTTIIWHLIKMKPQQAIYCTIHVSHVKKQHLTTPHSLGPWGTCLSALPHGINDTNVKNSRNEGTCFHWVASNSHPNSQISARSVDLFLHVRFVFQVPLCRKMKRIGELKVEIVDMQRSLTGAGESLAEAGQRVREFWVLCVCWWMNG